MKNLILFTIILIGLSSCSTNVPSIDYYQGYKPVNNLSTKLKPDSIYFFNDKYLKGNGKVDYGIGLIQMKNEFLLKLQHCIDTVNLLASTNSVNSKKWNLYSNIGVGIGGAGGVAGVLSKIIPENKDNYKNLTLGLGTAIAVFNLVSILVNGSIEEEKINAESIKKVLTNQTNLFEKSEAKLTEFKSQVKIFEIPESLKDDQNDSDTIKVEKAKKRRDLEAKHTEETKNMKLQQFSEWEKLLKEELKKAHQDLNWNYNNLQFN